MGSTSWIDDRWQSVTSASAGTWAAWAALALAVVALIYLHLQLRRSRRVTLERTRPHIGMFMEPHAADWHVIELVVRNFGQTPAYEVQFAFPDPPSVAQYETATDGYADVVELQLPKTLPSLAPGQEWRTVWDSAIDRAELGDAIESRFVGTVTYHDAPGRRRRRFSTDVVLDWDELPPTQRIELMTTHDLAKREKQKLELLRAVLTYFHYASKETRPDVFRTEIDRMNRAARETQDRWRIKDVSDTPTDAVVTVDGNQVAVEPGKHHN